jgi:hypothetical protein
VYVLYKLQSLCYRVLTGRKRLLRYVILMVSFCEINVGISGDEQLDPISSRCDQRHRQATIKIFGFGVVHLYDPVVGFQEPHDVRGAPFSDSVHVNSLLVETVADAEPVVVVNGVFVQRHVVDLVFLDALVAVSPLQSVDEVPRGLTVTVRIGEVVIGEGEGTRAEHVFSVRVKLELGVVLLLVLVLVREGLAQDALLVFDRVLSVCNWNRRDFSGVVTVLTADVVSVAVPRVNRTVHAQHSGAGVVASSVVSGLWTLDVSGDAELDPVSGGLQESDGVAQRTVVQIVAVDGQDAVPHVQRSGLLGQAPFRQSGQDYRLHAVLAPRDRDAQRTPVSVQLHGVDHTVEEQVCVLRLGFFDFEGHYVVGGGLEDLEGALETQMVQRSVVYGQEAVSRVQGADSVGDGAAPDLRDDEGFVRAGLRRRYSDPQTWTSLGELHREDPT